MGTFIAEYDGLLAGTCFAEITRDPRGYLHGRITNLTVRGRVSESWNWKCLT